MSSAKSRIVSDSKSGKSLTKRRNILVQMTNPMGKPLSVLSWKGASIVFANQVGAMRWKRSGPLNDLQMTIISIPLNPQILVVY